MLRIKNLPLLFLVAALALLFVLGDGLFTPATQRVVAWGQIVGDDDDDSTGDDDDDDDDDDIVDDDDDDDDDDNLPTTPIAGVRVDASGVLRMKLATDRTQELWRQRIREAQAGAIPAVARPSKLRKISLPRLEKALTKRLAAGLEPSDDMLYLAGLTRIKNVFLYPETGDLVIAGPAEGYTLDLVGRPLGLTTGQAIVELQDLAVALRAFGPDGKQTRTISVSIDPTQDGLVRMQQFLQEWGRRAVPQDTQTIVRGLRSHLGKQLVTITGVSPNTHFAQVLVEADYRMKLIGIGLERPPVNIVSYVARANPASVARNALQRWYFVPNYQSVRMSEDGLAMELVGDGVKLVNASELVQRDGARVATATTSRASQAFVTSFTKLYPELALRSPVYAQLRNLIDLTIAAAFIQEHDYYSQVNWTMPVLGSEEAFAVENLTAPKQVATAVNAVWKGRTLMTPIGGGVRISAGEALTSENLLADEEGAVAAVRNAITLDDLPEGTWWWD